ncbi:hypothetical protein [Pararhizobium haloflavum]|uniref:hypothetical protein n=1 Tax=Pararhizobium haloflavum TaxID=2037914 RepID=UPI0018E3FBA2|nr:hypothetical protein [Pararhizobium haloflavum]
MKSMDSVVEAVRADLLARSQTGIEKYGKTLDREDLCLREWLQHAYEETLDQANYLKRSIMEIDAVSNEWPIDKVLLSPRRAADEIARLRVGRGQSFTEGTSS